LTNTTSICVVVLAIYYAVRIVRLSDKFEFVALKGGRAPYFIIAGLLFLGLERVFDLLTGVFANTYGYPLTVTFNDPPAALSAFFILLGLREMYVVYIRNSKKNRAEPSHGEVWQVEEAGPHAQVSGP
jgi:hypothetical protein